MTKPEQKISHPPMPNIRRLREARPPGGERMTLEQLAEATGISLSQISRYERGGMDGRDAVLSHLRILAKFFGVSIDELVDSYKPAEEVSDDALLPQVYNNSLKDTDSIQVELGALRRVSLHAFRRAGISEARAQTLSHVLVATLSAQPSASAVVRLADTDRSPAGSPSLTPDGRS